jgi:hypothetical protein
MKVKGIRERRSLVVLRIGIPYLSLPGLSGQPSPNLDYPIKSGNDCKDDFEYAKFIPTLSRISRPGPNTFNYYTKVSGMLNVEFDMSRQGRSHAE